MRAHFRGRPLISCCSSSVSQTAAFSISQFFHPTFAGKRDLGVEEGRAPGGRGARQKNNRRWCPSVTNQAILLTYSSWLQCPRPSVRPFARSTPVQKSRTQKSDARRCLRCRRCEPLPATLPVTWVGPAGPPPAVACSRSRSPHLATLSALRCRAGCQNVITSFVRRRRERR